MTFSKVSLPPENCTVLRCVPFIHLQLSW